MCVYNIIGFIVFFLLILPFLFGVFEFFSGIEYVHTKERKKELLISHMKLIKDGYIIQGFPYRGFSVSYFAASNRYWFYPKLYDYFYKWAIYFRFKWFDRC